MEIVYFRIIVDVLRQAAKSCVVKREFKRAHILINQAVKRARFVQFFVILAFLKILKCCSDL